ncbi:MAG: NYN domain-containing protein [Spirochaetota bacterium]
MLGTSSVGASPYYIIDGYNVIFSRAFSERRSNSIEHSRDYLIKLLNSYASTKKIRMTVVWDGKEGPGLPRKGGGRVKCIYTRYPRTADEKIINMVESLRNRAGVIVVSNDRKHITGVARSLGARTMSVGQLLELVGCPERKPGRKNSGPGRPEISEQAEAAMKKMANDLSVEQWMKLFRSRDTR